MPVEFAENGEAVLGLRVFVFCVFVWLLLWVFCVFDFLGGLMWGCFWCWVVVWVLFGCCCGCG